MNEETTPAARRMSHVDATIATTLPHHTPYFRYSRLLCEIRTMTERRKRETAVSSTLSTPVLLILFVTPFLWNRQWYASGISVFVILMWQVCREANQIEESEKWRIRFNIMEAADIVQTLVDYETRQGQQGGGTNGEDEAQRRRETSIILTTGLATLAKKYNAVRVPKGEGTNQKQVNNNEQADELALLCQEAAYIGFRYFLDGNQDVDISAASVALLALIAKNAGVRERHRYQADVYGLDVPVQIIRQGLELAKEIEDDQAKEQDAAEVQRKSCLLLGALSEGDSDLAQLVSGEGGVEVIMNAARWYRWHAEVGNWALWALFILCYEYPPNKVVFFEAEGISLTIDIMRNCHESLEVSRHGVALIFDLMRENPEARLDVWRIRKAALAAGIHDVLVKAMQEHTEAMDIMMMGSEILVGTGFEGDIPTFTPPEMDTIER